MTRLNWEQIARLASPPLDTRQLGDMMQEMSALVPYYTPEWRFTPDDPDAGTALFYIVADMLLENWRRLNQAPLNNYLSFLSLIGVEPMPARAATTALTFRLSEGATRPVLIPAGTPVSAATATGEIVFETKAALLVTPARITDLYIADGRTDQLIQLPVAGSAEAADGKKAAVELPQAGLAEGELPVTDSATAQTQATRLFDAGQRQSLQQHVLYTNCPELEHLAGEVRLEWIPELEPTHLAQLWIRLLSNPQYARWSYCTGGKWREFDYVRAGTRRLYLFKAAGNMPEPSVVNEQQGVWLHCRLIFPLTAEASNHEIEQFAEMLSTVRLGNVSVLPAISAPPSAATMSETVLAEFASTASKAVQPSIGIVPERLLQDDLELEAGRQYPFGTLFYTYGCFYLHSSEVFSRKGSVITLNCRIGYSEHQLMATPENEPRWRPVMRASEFDPKRQDYAYIRQVSWEYWNGQAWVRLHSADSGTLQFVPSQAERSAMTSPLTAEDGTPIAARLNETAGQMHAWSFHCPNDLEAYPVNGIDGHWIRARIVELDNAYAPYVIYRSPWLEDVTLTYEYRQPITTRGWAALNGGEYIGYGAAYGRQPQPPFHMLEHGSAVCYIALDQPPTGGPLYVYAELEYQPLGGLADPARIDWEYWRSDSSSGNWSTLEVYDTTESMTVSGHIQWAGPPDFGRVRRFGREAYWIRLVDRHRRFGRDGLPYPLLRQLHWNTVPAIQQQSVQDEKPDVLRDRHGLYFRLLRAPVQDEQIWVDETDTADPVKWLQEQQRHPDGLRRETLPTGVERLWRRWTAVANLEHSNPDDHHYRIDRQEGIVRFGDGRTGRIPSATGIGRVRVDYRLSEGEQGNVDAHSVTQPRYARAFIQDVFNPVPAFGGHNREKVAEAAVRGPRQLRHRDRAVTAEDYEHLARAADAHVARVRCFSGYNGQMEREAGSVTLVVMARDEGAGKRYFPELSLRIRQYLHPRMSGMIFPEQLYVIEPVRLEVDIAGTIIVRALEDLVPVEEQCEERLHRFLNPVTGKADGQGWQIGEQPLAEMFYPLLQSVSGVRYIQKLTMEIFMSERDGRRELTPEQAASLRHCIVSGGQQSLKVRTNWD
ncbi:putative baseplate assembly protein [Paenibacillus campi]|uniref:putative baseplate assembly protein n=1 Tax=Paenibacillus campi TaxID=3106031 RepID=UPI002AFFA297|nr:putative baseplate assembly protein [Paenibacillus sp. SGZ-1014]